jgi:hypothetical protein
MIFGVGSPIAGECSIRERPEPGFPALLKGWTYTDSLSADVFTRLEKLAREVHVQSCAVTQATEPLTKEAALTARAAAVAALGGELATQQAALVGRDRLATAAAKIARDASTIPGLNAFAKVDRYETSLRRARDRAVTLFMKVRERRKGDEGRRAPDADFAKQTHRAG